MLCFKSANTVYSTDQQSLMFLSRTFYFEGSISRHWKLTCLFRFYILSQQLTCHPLMPIGGNISYTWRYDTMDIYLLVFLCNKGTIMNESLTLFVEMQPHFERTVALLHYCLQTLFILFFFHSPALC